MTLSHQHLDLEAVDRLQCRHGRLLGSFHQPSAACWPVSQTAAPLATVDLAMPHSRGTARRGGTDAGQTAGHRAGGTLPGPGRGPRLRAENSRQAPAIAERLNNVGALRIHAVPLRNWRGRIIEPDGWRRAKNVRPPNGAVRLKAPISRGADCARLAFRRFARAIPWSAHSAGKQSARASRFQESIPISSECESADLR